LSHHINNNISSQSRHQSRIIVIIITFQIFEAFPVDTCVAQRQSDGNAFSLKFGIDDDTNPLVTYCFGSTDCGASNSKLKSAATSLFSGRLMSFL